MAKNDPIYIHGLRAENFMRLELVALQFEGPGLEQVTGDNGEGKSSLLNAIWAALGGKTALPDQPVRKGEKRAEVELDLGDKVVKLKVKPDRSCSLSLEGKDGVVYKSPQKVLDELVGRLAFDPLAFASQDPKQQAVTLRQLANLDVSDLDVEREKLYEQRSGVNREAKLLEGQLAGIVVPELPQLATEAKPPEEIDITELAKKYNAAVNQKAENDKQRARQGKAATVVVELQDRVSSLRSQLAEAEAALSKTKVAKAQLEDELAKLVDPDMGELAKELDGAKAHNAESRKAATDLGNKIRDHELARAEYESKLKARAAKETELAGAQARSGALSKQIEEIDSKKVERLANAKFPCDGLSVDGDTVTFNGIPLSQASSAEQLRVCLGVAAALNPKLRVLLVRQGNDLDIKRLRMVAEWAKDKGYQVLMERVASNTPVGIVIEAGKVSADLRSKDAAEPAKDTKTDGKKKSSPEDDDMPF